MTDEPRELLKAAQEAELRGDKAQAIKLLYRAAQLYREAGTPERAQQLVRHIRRLDGKSLDGMAEVTQLAWQPDSSLVRVVSEDATSEAETSPHPLVERGPTLADPELSAWCSFCCRPQSDVGALVAGPAGSFVCASCVREAGALLGTPEAPSPSAAAAQAPAVSPATPPSRPVPLIGQEDGVRVLEAGLRLNAGFILLVGPEGSGKSTCLRALAAQGVGAYLSGPPARGGFPRGRRLLLDGMDDASAAELRGLAQTLREDPERTLLLALRGALAPSLLILENEAARLPLYSTAQIVEATGGRLPLELAERVQVVAPFGRAREEDLLQMARERLSTQGDALDLSDPLLNAVVSLAVNAPRGGHELNALLSRIPKGTWRLPVEPSPPKKRRGRKRAEEG